MPTRGAGIVKPTTVDKTGTGSSATINTNGSVTFSTCTALSLNGIFTSTYDNYMIVCRVSHNTTTANYVINSRLRTSGTDATSTSDYNTQTLIASSTSITAARTTADGFWKTSRVIDSPNWGGFIVNLYGPFLSQPTAFRTISADTSSDASIYDAAGTHELSTSYDGITIYPTGVSLSGLVCVYGLRN